MHWTRLVLPCLGKPQFKTQDLKCDVWKLDSDYSLDALVINPILMYYHQTMKGFYAYNGCKGTLLCEIITWCLDYLQPFEAS